jgi:hypothetical protein
MGRSDTRDNGEIQEREDEMTIRFTPEVIKVHKQRALDAMFLDALDNGENWLDADWSCR